MTSDGGEGERIADLRGFRCPLPVLKTRVRLRAMAPGERIVVLTDDPLAGRHDAAGLATVIERLVADEVTRASLGARARDHVVRHHSLDRAAVRLDELIAPLAKRDGPR